MDRAGGFIMYFPDMPLKTVMTVMTNGRGDDDNPTRLPSPPTEELLCLFCAAASRQAAYTHALVPA